MGVHVAIDAERCKGCELCVAFCTHQVLAMVRAMNSKGAHFPEMTRPDSDCTGCRQCAVICPEAAIELERTGETGDASSVLACAHDGK
ncbi:MAG: 4Fe-4S dicluster domain-containing protein [Lentisphaerae bacterium]|nr:4Fe-4S dicluster domain-containing protein [Lentisphaerota bacterium]